VLLSRARPVLDPPSPAPNYIYCTLYMHIYYICIYTIYIYTIHVYTRPVLDPSSPAPNARLAHVEIVRGDRAVALGTVCLETGTGRDSGADVTLGRT
jgi:hypothetical protein